MPPSSDWVVSRRRLAQDPMAHPPPNSVTSTLIDAEAHFNRGAKSFWGYGQSWCTASGGDLLLSGFDGLAVTEANALDHLGEPVGSVQVAPMTLGRFGELEDHGERRFPRQ